jgi:hypothetical protein
VLPKCRRLISTNTAAVAAYNTEMDRQFKIHCIEERMLAIDEATQGMFPIPRIIDFKPISLTFKWAKSNYIAKRAVELHVASIQLLLQTLHFGTNASEFLRNSYA